MRTLSKVLFITSLVFGFVACENYEDEFLASQEQIKALEAELTQAQQSILNLEAQAQLDATKLNDLNDQLDTLENELVSQELLTDEAKAQLEVAHEEIEALQNEIADLQNQIANLNDASAETIAALEAALEAAESEIEVVTEVVTEVVEVIVTETEVITLTEVQEVVVTEVVTDTLVITEVVTQVTEVVSIVTEIVEVEVPDSTPSDVVSDTDSDTDTDTDTDSDTDTDADADEDEDEAQVEEPFVPTFTVNGNGVTLHSWNTETREAYIKLTKTASQTFKTDAEILAAVSGSPVGFTKHKQNVTGNVFVVKVVYTQLPSENIVFTIGAFANDPVVEVVETCDETAMVSISEPVAGEPVWGDWEDLGNPAEAKITEQYTTQDQIRTGTVTYTVTTTKSYDECTGKDDEVTYSYYSGSVSEEQTIQVENTDYIAGVSEINGHFYQVQTTTGNVVTESEWSAWVGGPTKDTRTKTITTQVIATTTYLPVDFANDPAIADTTEVISTDVETLTEERVKISIHQNYAYYAVGGSHTYDDFAGGAADQFRIDVYGGGHVLINTALSSGSASGSLGADASYSVEWITSAGTDDKYFDVTITSNTHISVTLTGL